VSDRDDDDDARVDVVLRAFPIERQSWSRLGRGLINRTFAVAGEPGHVLQRVSPIFAPEIHHNIRAVTQRLRERGVTTPLIVETRAGTPWHTEADGSVWRLLTRVSGETAPTPTPARAHSAGRLVGRWHAALDDLEHEFVGMRRGVHDTDRHLRALAEALDERPSHRLHQDATRLAEQIFAAARELPPLPPGLERPCHGDLKLDNVVFVGDEAVALVDLDTVGPMSLAHELGDAFRSWCNPSGEDEDREIELDLDIFAAAVEGYRADYGRPFTPPEQLGLLHGIEWIALELSARFLADALLERYFGWDPTRFPTRGAHNLLRARTQLAVHRAAVTSRDRRRDLIR
jgi:Ser/Thr protein kinase RdoA (MazF antagonist)